LRYADRHRQELPGHPDAENRPPGVPVMKWLFWLTGVIALSGVIHIGTILAIPRLAPHDAWSRIAAEVPGNGFTALPIARPGAEVIPLMDPSVQYGVCRYDLSEGPLGMEAMLP